MTGKENKRYLAGSAERYGSYDSIKERTEALSFGNVKDQDMLDIGAGEGYLAILAARDFNCNVTIIDISEEKINTAKENARKEGVLGKINFKLNNALNISYKDNTFDSVVSFNALHHNKDDYEKIVKEMIRVAKGNIVVTELNKKGVRAFDEYIHPESNHKDMAIHLKELENVLMKYSKVKRLDRKLLSTFVCEKNR